MTVPANSQSTGISIFIDSRITIVAPGSTCVAGRDGHLRDVGDHLGAHFLGHVTSCSTRHMR